MLSKHLCPHTGVVNFFTKTDPHLSVGSIIKSGEADEFHWRFYAAAKTISGIAADMRTAERRIKEHIRRTSDALPRAPH